MADDRFKFRSSRFVVVALAAFAVVMVALAIVVSRFVGQQHEPQQEAERPPWTGSNGPTPPQPGPGETASLPPMNVQYVATAERGPAYQNDPLERVEIVRGARWVREEKVEDGVTRVQFSRINSENRVTWSRSADGVRETLSAQFESVPPGGRYGDMFFTNTGYPAVALGERCTIWSGDRARVDDRRHYTRITTCITEDGIRLWTRGVDFEGNERVTSRLLTLQRRTVTAEEEAPPPHLFRWSTWRGEIEAAPEHNLSIEMSSPRARSDEHPQVDSEVTRERGAWRYVHTVNGGRVTGEGWTISTPRLWFDYQEGEFMVRTRSLTISRTPRSPQRTDHYVLLDPPRTETIAGIRCRWFDTAPGMDHGSASACISSDNLTLARTYGGDGVRAYGSFNVRATRVSRDPLPISALTPPTRAFDWLD